MPQLTPCRLLLLIPAFLALSASLPIVEGYAQEAQPASTVSKGTGLEIDNYQTVEVVVEDLSELSKYAERIGLTEDRIRTRVELRLRQAKLKPVRRGEPGERNDGFLYVWVKVVGNAFTIDVEYQRWFLYPVSTGVKQCLARAWATHGVGIYGENSALIVQNLDERLDTFLNEYLKANEQ